MKLSYKVHSVSTEKATVKAVVEGEETEATVDLMVVELVGDDGRNTHMLRLRGSKDERSALVEKMRPGAAVELHIVFPEA